MSPFARLALFAAGCAIAGGLFAVAEYVSVLVALGAAFGGVLLAIAVTIELDPRPPRRLDEELSRFAVDRAEIERRARAARAEVDDD